jgi:hypothetical protein
MFFAEGDVWKEKQESIRELVRHLKADKNKFGRASLGYCATGRVGSTHSEDIECTKEEKSTRTMMMLGLNKNKSD